MCLAECRIHEQAQEVNEIHNTIFEMVPHWPGVCETHNGFHLSTNLYTKEDVKQYANISRLAFELPPIMLPRRITP